MGHGSIVFEGTPAGAEVRQLTSARSGWRSRALVPGASAGVDRRIVATGTFVPGAETLESNDRSFSPIHPRGFAMSATYPVRGDVAVITLDNPPVNGLGHATRLGIVAGPRSKRSRDDAVKAIVITGAGKAFSGGADIREFGSPKALAEPNLLTRHRRARGEHQAGGRRDARGGDGRRPRAGARLPLPRRRAGRADRAARGQDRPDPGRRRHAAAAARARPRERAQHDRLAASRSRASCSPRRRGRSCSTGSSTATCVEGAIAFAQGDRRQAPAAAGARPQGRATRTPTRYLQFARNTVGAMAKNFPAPLKCIEAVAASAEDAVRRTA